MITVLHGGGWGSGQMITALQRGGPSNDYGVLWFWGEYKKNIISAYRFKLFFMHDKFFYMIISGWVGHLWTAPKTRIFVYLYFCIFILLYFCILYFVFVLFAFFIFLYLYIFVPTYLFCTFKLDCQGWKASQKFSKIVMSIAYHGVVVFKDVKWRLLKCKFELQISISAFALKCDRGLLKTMKTRDTRRGQHYRWILYICKNHL